MTGSYKKWATNQRAQLEDLYRTENKVITSSQPKATKETNFYIKKIDRKLVAHSNRYSANRDVQSPSAVNFIASKPLNDKIPDSLEKLDVVLNPEHNV